MKTKLSSPRFSALAMARDVLGLGLPVDPYAGEVLAVQNHHRVAVENLVDIGSGLFLLQIASSMPVLVSAFSAR